MECCFLRQRKPERNLIPMYSLKGCHMEEGEGVSVSVPRDKTRTSGRRLQVAGFFYNWSCVQGVGAVQVSFLVLDVCSGAGGEGDTSRGR